MRHQKGVEKVSIKVASKRHLLELRQALKWGRVEPPNQCLIFLEGVTHGIEKVSMVLASMLGIGSRCLAFSQN